MGSIRKIITQHLVKHLLVAVTKEDILTMTSRGWSSQGRKVSPEERTQLSEECRQLRQSLLWRYMRNEIRYVASLRMFEKSATGDNSVFGRAMLYNLELIENFLDNGAH